MAIKAGVLNVVRCVVKEDVSEYAILSSVIVAVEKNHELAGVQISGGSG